MQEALGLIETRGMSAALEAADAAVKSADVKLAEIEYPGGAMVTVKLIGDVAAVRSAVEAGAASASKIGEIVSTHVIPRPHSEIEFTINAPIGVSGETGCPDVIKGKTAASETPKKKKSQDK